MNQPWPICVVPERKLSAGALIKSGNESWDQLTGDVPTIGN
jgi:hypothetical protein